MDVLSIQGSVGSLMDMTIGLRLDPVRHEGVWDGTRPRPRRWPEGQGPVGAYDRASDEATGR